MSNREYPDRDALYSIALEAGDKMRSAFIPHRRIPTDRKDDGSPVTLVDKAVNRQVIDYFREKYPHITVVGEEESGKFDDRISDMSQIAVVVDPVDGTEPFRIGSPHAWTFCISVIKDGSPVVALIHDPLFRCTWTAEKGQGSFFRDASGTTHRQFVPEESLEGSMVSMLWWKDGLFDLSGVAREIENTGARWSVEWAIAIWGAYIATGNVAANIFGGRTAWEAPAMQLIVEEAGGVATDVFGNDLSYDIYVIDGKIDDIKGHIMSNGFVHEQLLEIVARTIKAQE